jgi:hypothetical protein
MASAVVEVAARRVPRALGRRTMGRDVLLIALAALHAVILLTWPTVVTIALGLWWNANTISHNFIHRPFFRACRANFAFACYLSALLGFPQTLWRDRHLAHHAGFPARVRISGQLAGESLAVFAVWTALVAWSPRFFALVYLPGFVAGLLLSHLQGHYEHARGVTSHYGWLYNFLCFNDGYHAEHHAHPGVHWSELPARIQPGTSASRWPALLRWLDAVNLESLERIVLRSPRLQAMVLRCHREAFRRLLRDHSQVTRVIIVGGGLFPRTALLLRELLPGASITVLDASRLNLDAAAPLLPGGTHVICRRYFPGESLDCDLAVFPLSFSGDRDRAYRDPPARVTLIHDWIWRRHGRSLSSVVSMFLLKRVNLVLR